MKPRGIGVVIWTVLLMFWVGIVAADIYGFWWGLWGALAAGIHSATCFFDGALCALERASEEQP